MPRPFASPFLPFFSEQVLRLQGGSLRACDIRHLLQLPPSPSLGPWSSFFDPPLCPPPLPCLRVLDLGYNSLAAGEDLAALATAIEDGAMPRLEVRARQSTDLQELQGA